MLWLTAALMLSPAWGVCKDREVKGYITRIHPGQNAFEIWRNQVEVPEDVEFEVKDNERGLRISLEDLRLGMHVKVKGKFDDNKYRLTARKITVDADQFENNIQRTAVLYQDLLNLEPAGSGWNGWLRLDGQAIRITPQTVVSFQLNRVEKKLAKEAEKKEDDDFEDEDSEDFEFQPLSSLEDVRAGDICEYTGRRNEDGTVTATRLVFRKNDREKNEEKLFKKLALSEKPSDEGKHGRLQVGGYKFKTYPDQAVTIYVRYVGQRLVPDYQNELPAGDPRKIDFRFYVVDGDKYPNAFAFPNGVIGINTAMLLMLENEAQLAFVLGHEIAHALNEHTYRQLMFHRKKRMAMKIGGIAAAVLGQRQVANALVLTQAAITNGYQRFLEDQSDRYGLRFAADRGYDLHQSVQVWINMMRNFGDSGSNFFWSSHSSHSERISYLLVEIGNNYPREAAGIDTEQELGSDRYQTHTAALRQDPRLKKLRKRMEKYREKYEKEEGQLRY